MVAANGTIEYYNFELEYSHEALVGSIPYNVDNHDTGSIRSLNNRSPVSANNDPTFWVPHVQRQHSGGPSCSGGVEGQVISTDDSMPATPTSPTGSFNSMALSMCSGSSNVPIARSDKHVVLAMSPARPKVASMQAKLDHTKIDTSLYDSVSHTRKFFCPGFFVKYQSTLGQPRVQ